jgi:tol-pal system protein YbgF
VTRTDRAAALRRVVFAGVLAAAAAAIPARAGLFDDAEARRRIDLLRNELSQQGKENEARIAKLEESIHSIGVIELVRQLEDLNAELARLRGQLEVLANENQQIQKRQRDFYLDLDSRLKRLEGGSGAAASSSPPGDGGGAAIANSAATTPSATSHASTKEDQAREVKSYDAASNLFRRNDFASAIDAFRAFVKDYPSSPLAANAGYWIGISYANMRDYRNALAAQEELLAKYPQSPKAPDALLAIAAVQSEQGDAGSARNTLEDIIARYPLSEAAGKARTRLTQRR